MSERSKEHASKACEVKASASSNLALSACKGSEVTSEPFLFLRNPTFELFCMHFGTIYRRCMHKGASYDPKTPITSACMHVIAEINVLCMQFGSVNSAEMHAICGREAGRAVQEL